MSIISLLSNVSGTMRWCWDESAAGYIQTVIKSFIDIIETKISIILFQQNQGHKAWCIIKHSVRDLFKGLYGNLQYVFFLFCERKLV